MPRSLRVTFFGVGLSRRTMAWSRRIMERQTCEMIQPSTCLASFSGFSVPHNGLLLLLFFPPFAALWAISKAVGSSLTIALHTHANDERKRLGLYSRLAMLEGLPCWQQPPDTELEVPRTENVKEKEISAREGQKEPRIDDTANEQY